MLHQSPTAKRKSSPSNPTIAGALHVAVFTHAFATAFTSVSDKLELGFMPADAKIKSATIIGEGLGAITASVGFMSGTPGDNDDTRTVGTEFFTTQSVNDTEQAITALVAKGIAASTADRSIGLILSGDVAASAAKKVSLVIEYYK